MSYLSQYHDSISTVQLSPFGEEQWNRIVTYSPIYVHWTDMVMMSQQRTNKSALGKLNSKDQIDLNTIKLEDEILLNELYQFRRAATIPAKGKDIVDHEGKVLEEERDQHIASSIEDYQTSSGFYPETKEPVKPRCSYVEQSFTQQPYTTKRSVLNLINQTISPPVNVHIQTSKLPNISLGPKPQPSLGVQLRQSAIAREHVLSAAQDRYLSSPLSMASSKRTITSAHSHYYHHHHPQQQLQYRTSQSPLPTEMNSRTSNAHEKSSRESPLPPARKLRARSTTSSRSTMHMLKTKNNRTRQKQNIDLKTLLVEPWKQVLNADELLGETIPNSLELMHQMCGPATAFEQNLRYNFRRQLNHFRNGSLKAGK